MNIALLTCNARSVPPKKSGGIEKIMFSLLTGLQKHGHTITLFASGDSQVPAGVELVSVTNTAVEYLSIPDKEKDELNTVLTKKLGSLLLSREKEFDIIHNHCLDAALPVLEQLPPEKTPTTIHEAVEPDAISRINRVLTYPFISVSNTQRSPLPNLSYLSTIHNAVSVSDYPLPSLPKDYIVFVGRISQQKTPHLAIQLAKRLGKKLLILGKYKDEHIEKDYFEETFLPKLKNNLSFVNWIGEKTEQEVMSYFQHALFSIHTASFQDPCPLSPIESMASGCPVLALSKGAYPEIIEQGKTGFVGKTIEELELYAQQISSIDRNYCRKYVETKFNTTQMVTAYEHAYQQLLSKRAHLSP